MSVIRLITLVISPAMQVTERSLHLPGLKHISDGSSSTLAPTWLSFSRIFHPGSHFSSEALWLLNSRWRQISRHGGSGPRGEWPKQTFLPVGRESLFSASQLCRGRAGGLVCALFIRRLPSRCLPGSSQTGLS